MIWWRLFWWMFKRMTLAGAGLGAAYGSLIFLLVGTMFGLLFGAVLGMATGLVSGLAIVLLTRQKFYPPQASSEFQQWAAGVAVISTAVTSLLLMNGLFAGAAALVIIPSVIAAVTAGYFAWNYPTHAQRIYAQRDLVEDDYMREKKSPIVW